MNEAFFTALKARLTELTASLRYLHKPSGTAMRPQIIDLMMDRPTAAVDEAEEYPFVRWMLLDGEFHRGGRPSPFRVAVDCGIYTDGSIVDGNADICELCRTLGEGLMEWQRYAGCRLSGPIRYTMGTPQANAQNPDNPGLQPHPYYHARLFLDFLAS